MIRFTELPDKLKYPAAIKGILSTQHSAVITYVSQNFRGTHIFKRKVIGVLNTLSYLHVSGDTVPATWTESDPLELSLVDEENCKEILGSLYIKLKDVEWDVKETYDSADHDVTVTSDSPAVTSEVVSESKPIVIHSRPEVAPSIVLHPTPKEDLYLKPPTVPQFDISRPWMRGLIGGDLYVIYTSLPDVPRKQNQISVTTDIDLFTYNDLMRLYPNQFIRTRAACMYEQVPGLDYEPDIGVILPIEGFTREQILDNIIKYPHFFKLSRVVDNNIVSFYTTIELDGELHKTLDIWNTLPESAKIPRSSEFIKEYVVRRYLLERDVKGIAHRYPMYGSLEPFLTLFTTCEDYIRLGYTDTLDIAKQCVSARVAYKQTRNPIIRRLADA